MGMRDQRRVEIPSARELELMSESCLLAAATLAMLGREVKPGITTEDLDRLSVEFIRDHGATAAPLNYRGFPKSICTSPNDVVCHGIPSKKVRLKAGDILNIDVTTILHGFHGDTNRTFAVGEISPEARDLMEAAHEAMWLGIRPLLCFMEECWRIVF